MDVMGTSRSPMSKLGTIKYTEWEKSMYERLMLIGVARIVTGEEIQPSLEPSNPASFTMRNSYQLRSDRAAGEIYQWLDEGNKIHVDTIRDQPAAMWKKLREFHLKSTPNSRLNSLSDLLSIRKRDDESLTDLCARIEGAMQYVRALRPPPITESDGTVKPAYTIEMLDDELSIIVMLSALPREDYAAFLSSVRMLKNLTKDAVLEAFRIEEVQRQAARAIICFLCDGPHKIKNCPDLQTLRSQVKKDDGGSKSKKRRGRRGAN